MLDAVLPLKISSHGGSDLARATILLRTLATFFRRGDLGVLHVVHHESDDPEQIRAVLAPFDGLGTKLHDESVLIPGLAGTSRRHWRKWFRKARAKNWFRQQVVKLAVAEHVETDFYLTLDADVVCTRPTRESDLFVGPRAILDQEPRAQNPRWWRRSAPLVGVPLDLGGWGAGVTPTLLSRDLARGLIAHLESRSGRRGWVEFLLSAKGWSEYSLYDLYARKTGRLERFHYLDPNPEHPERAVKRPDALWKLPDGARPEDTERILETWAERAFDPRGCGHFSLVQSRTGIPAERVWEAIESRIQPRTAATPPALRPAGDPPTEAAGASPNHRQPPPV